MCTVVSTSNHSSGTSGSITNVVDYDDADDPASGGIWTQVKKGVYHAKVRSVTGSKNTKESIKIINARLKILERKKSFGIEFLDLMLSQQEEDQQGAEEAALELEACVDEAMADIHRLQEKITRWSGVIVKNNEKLQRKLSGTNYKNNKKNKSSSITGSISIVPIDPHEQEEESDDEDDDDDGENEEEEERYYSDHYHIQEGQREQQEEAEESPHQEVDEINKDIAIRDDTSVTESETSDITSSTGDLSNRRRNGGDHSSSNVDNGSASTTSGSSGSSGDGGEEQSVEVSLKDWEIDNFNFKLIRWQQEQQQALLSEAPSFDEASDCKNSSSSSGSDTHTPKDQEQEQEQEEDVSAIMHSAEEEMEPEVVEKQKDEEEEPQETEDITTEDVTLSRDGGDSRIKLNYEQVLRKLRLDHEMKLEPASTSTSEESIVLEEDDDDDERSRASSVVTSSTSGGESFNEALEALRQLVQKREERVQKVTEDLASCCHKQDNESPSSSRNLGTEEEETLMNEAALIFLQEVAEMAVEPLVIEEEETEMDADFVIEEEDDTEMGVVIEEEEETETDTDLDVVIEEEEEETGADFDVVIEEEEEETDTDLDVVIEEEEEEAAETDKDLVQEGTGSHASGIQSDRSLDYSSQESESGELEDNNNIEELVENFQSFLGLEHRKEEEVHQQQEEERGEDSENDDIGSDKQVVEEDISDDITVLSSNAYQDGEQGHDEDDDVTPNTSSSEHESPMQCIDE